MNYYLIGIIYSAIYLLNLRVVFENLKDHYNTYEKVTLGDLIEELLMNLNPFRIFNVFGFGLDFVVRQISWVLSIKLLDKRKK